MRLKLTRTSLLNNTDGSTRYVIPHHQRVKEVLYAKFKLITLHSQYWSPLRLILVLSCCILSSFVCFDCIVSVFFIFYFLLVQFCNKYLSPAATMSACLYAMCKDASLENIIAVPDDSCSIRASLDAVSSVVPPTHGSRQKPFDEAGFDV